MVLLMKAKFTVSIEESIYEKIKIEAEKAGTSVSEVLEVAAMAVVDRKALLKHTGGLFRQLGQVFGEEIIKVKHMEKIKE